MTTPADSTQNLEEIIREITRDEISSIMAAALADPDVNPDAKSLAGYTLEYLSRKA